MSTRLALHLLGAPRLELDNAPFTADRRKTLALLAYLGVNRWQHHRDHISALLWPDYDQPKAYTNLRHILWEVGQVIGEGWIVARRDTIGLIPGDDHSSSPSGAGRTIWLDVARFKSLINESRAHAQREAARRIPLLLDSVNLYRNHFLTGFSLKHSPVFNEWAVAESEELQHQLAQALTMLVTDYCSLKEPETAVQHAQRLVALDPLNEASHRQLMQVYIQAGQNGAALTQYQTCEKILRKELGVDPQPETRALYRQIRKGEIKPTQLIKQKDVGVPKHNLPFQISKFIGREKELDEVKDLIAEHRLVSLVGTGGIGKTRLSLKVGEQLTRDYADGVWLVELASLKDSARVPQTVAAVFDLLQGSEESPTEKLIRVLRPKTALLILDNCEHLLDACAQLADTLLRNCPNLKILTSSREPLGITGEAQYHVPPLGLPDPQLIVDNLLDYESIQLFEERARLVQEHFVITMENSFAVTHICRRLDGIPLAIELAAARVDRFSTEQIALRLDESLNLLTGGSRTALPRQQTLRASINWSWNLLWGSEQTLLRRLSIFAGGWTLDAAEAVCAGNEIQSPQILDAITHLVAKSLVVINEEQGREKRYSLLEMIREYAHEKLVEAGEEDKIRDQHLRYFMNLSEQIEYGLMGSEQVELMARTIDERDNLRAALEHASRINDVEAGLFISGRLRNYWENFDIREGVHWLAEFLQRPESKQYPLARAKALYAQGWNLSWFHKFDEAQSMAEECLALYRAAGDPYGEVDGLNLLGGISEDAEKKSEYCQQALALARSLGDVMRQTTALNLLGWDHRDFKRAFAYWEEAVTLYRQIGGWRYLASVLSMLGYFLVMEGEIESAQKYLDESNLLYQKLRTKRGKSHLLIAYGQIALMQGAYEQARAYFQENARLGNEAGSRMDYLWSRARLGYVELRAGDITEARHVFDETARNFQKDGSKSGVMYTLEGMSSLYVAVGKPEYAARLLGWAEATRKEIGAARPILEQADVDRDIATAVAKIGNDAFDEAYDKGRAMTIDEAVAYALDEADL